jgi:hypothetical protein
MSAASDHEYRDIAMESADAAGESGRGGEGGYWWTQILELSLRCHP